MLDLEQLRADLEATIASADPAVSPRDRAKAREQLLDLFGAELREQARDRQLDREVRQRDAEELDGDLDGFLGGLVLALGSAGVRERFPRFAEVVNELAHEAAPRLDQAEIERRAEELARRWLLERRFTAVDGGSEPEPEDAPEEPQEAHEPEERVSDEHGPEIAATHPMLVRQSGRAPRF